MYLVISGRSTNKSSSILLSSPWNRAIASVVTSNSFSPVIPHNRSSILSAKTHQNEKIKNLNVTNSSMYLFKFGSTKVSLIMEYFFLSF